MAKIAVHDYRAARPLRVQKPTWPLRCPPCPLVLLASHSGDAFPQSRPWRISSDTTQRYPQLPPFGTTRRWPSPALLSRQFVSSLRRRFHHAAGGPLMQVDVVRCHANARPRANASTRSLVFFLGLLFCASRWASFFF